MTSHSIGRPVSIEVARPNVQCRGRSWRAVGRGRERPFGVISVAGLDAGILVSPIDEPEIVDANAVTAGAAGVTCPKFRTTAV